MNIHQQSRHALGSEAVLTIVTTNEAQAERVLAILWAQVEEFEARFSRFKSTSELSEFNLKASQETAISTEFRGLLGAAKQLAEQTDGLYNPLILPALQRAGYQGSWPTPDQFDAKLDHRKRQIASATDIGIAEDSATIPANAALDFGGIGKGYLLDKLGELAHASGIASYWFSLGGDVLCEGYDDAGNPWQIEIAKASEPERTAAFCHNDNGERLAIATSGTTKRRGANWHHLIDPRTGQSADTDILTATALATTATAADVFAKCIVIAGSASTEVLSRKYDLAGAIIQTKAASLITHNPKGFIHA